MRPSPIVPLLLGLAATVAHGQQTARLVKYHANDIVSVRAKMRYTTLIELPPTEKIMEVATGDKDFWIIDTAGNYCFLHPAKEGNYAHQACSRTCCEDGCNGSSRVGEASTHGLQSSPSEHHSSAGRVPHRARAWDERGQWHRPQQ